MIGKYCVLLSLIGILLFSGCAITSYHPWIDEDYLIGDDRMAGVWQGDTQVKPKKGPSDNDFIIVQAAKKAPEDDADGKESKAPDGYYGVTYYNHTELESHATEENVFPEPARLIGGLYRVDDTLIAQIWGYTMDDAHLLVAPMYAIFKVEYSEDEILMYELKLDGIGTKDLQDADLFYSENKEGPSTFFSETEKMFAFLEAYHSWPGFFGNEPKIVLRRIRDLREDPE